MRALGVSDRTREGLHSLADIEERPAWRRLALDLLGPAIFGVLALWTFWVAAQEGGSPGPVATLLLACGLTWATARILGAWNPLLVPITLIAAAGIFVVGAPSETLSRTPLSGPFGYANAEGAFFVQAEAAALLLAALSQPVILRWFGWVSALGLATLALASGSLAAAALALALLAIAGVRSAPRAGRLTVTACGCAFLLALAATTVLAVRSSDAQRFRAAGEALSSRRLALWEEALAIAGQHPVSGVGPGRFAAVSPTARSDADTRMAHHGFLQQGAEGGFVAFGLLVLLFVWAFWSLRSAAGWNPGAALAGAAVAALGIHASVDYILHFPAVPLAASALAGTGRAGSDTWPAWLVSPEDDG